MPATPDVSIIVPCFNVAGYIQRAVGSVLAQTITNLQVIAIDDGSSDSTYQELLSINDPRLKVYRFINNRGISAALNLGIREAKGRYIASISADDKWLPTKLEKQIDYLIKNRIDIVGSWTVEETETDSGRIPDITNRFAIKTNAITFFLTSNNVGIGSTLLAKRDVITAQLDEELQTNEDWEYFARLSILGAKFDVIPEVLTICTRRPEGLSKTKSTAVQAQLAIEKFKLHISDYLRAQSYLRSALWMINPEYPRLTDALILAKKAVKTHFFIVFSKNFYYLLKLFLINRFQRSGKTEKKYS